MHGHMAAWTLQFVGNFVRRLDRTFTYIMSDAVHTVLCQMDDSYDYKDPSYNKFGALLITLGLLRLLISVPGKSLNFF